MNEKRRFPTTSVEQAVKFAELHSQYFSPTAGGPYDRPEVQATPFKIFSLTKNDVSVSYTNTAKIQ